MGSPDALLREANPQDGKLQLAHQFVTRDTPGCRQPLDSAVLWRNTQVAADYWESELGASSFVVRALRFGIYERPSATSSWRIRFSLPPILVTSHDQERVSNEMAECLHRRIYEEMTPAEVRLLQRPGFRLSNSFVITIDKRRLVINLSRQSQLFESRPIKMETMESFASELEQDDLLFSFDVKKGYHHFRLHPKVRNWFLFRLQKRYYRCIALPFGWKLSPHWLIKIMRPMVGYTRSSLGIRIHPYMDDFLLACNSQKQLHQARQKVQNCLTICGLTRKIEKGCWESGHQRDHLGFTIFTTSMTFGVTQARRQKLHNVATLLLRKARRNRRLVDVSSLRHFCGVAVCCTLAFPLARFYSRSLYEALGTATIRRVRLSHQALRDLRQWQQLRDHQLVRAIYRPAPTLALHSDVSTSIGQGGTLGRDLSAGSPGELQAQALCDPTLRTKPINFLELRAVIDNLRAFSSELPDPAVRIIKLWEDNQVVVAIITSMTSRSPELMRELRLLKGLLVDLDIRIDAAYLPSVLNRYADRLSRLKSTEDWRINPGLLSALLGEPPPTIDRFAAEGNAVCARFNSAHRTPTTLAVNSLQQPWGGTEINFWNPPLKLIPLTVAKIFKERAVGILVTPHWPAQSWFGRLKQLCRPNVYDAGILFRPPVWAPHNSAPPRWRLAVWMLSSSLRKALPQYSAGSMRRCYRPLVSVIPTGGDSWQTSL